MEYGRPLSPLLNWGGACIRCAEKICFYARYPHNCFGTLGSPFNFGPPCFPFSPGSHAVRVGDKARGSCFDVTLSISTPPAIVKTGHQVFSHFTYFFEFYPIIRLPDDEVAVFGHPLGCMDCLKLFGVFPVFHIRVICTGYGAFVYRYSPVCQRTRPVGIIRGRGCHASGGSLVIP